MQKTYRRTLHSLPSDAAEAWLFESPENRRQAERHYATKGQSVTIHSAYKTLLSDILETGLLDGAKRAIVRYPVVPEDEPARFLLECYPLAELCDCLVDFEPFDCPIHDAQSLPYYEVIVDNAVHNINVPVQWVVKNTGEKQLVACGWVVKSDGTQSALPTEFETIYHDVCDFIDNVPITANPPFFDTLKISVGLPVRDTALPVGDEHISLREALHEDIYFSALELFQHRLGLPSGTRELMPGQVLPNVVYSEQPFLNITEQSSCNQDADEIGGFPQLDSATHWLTPQQIHNHLQHLSGVGFSVTSRQGREVLGCFCGNTDAPIKLALSGGQHANESSGIVGALRAAKVLSTQADVAFTICPLENPDGYAAFRQLCRDNPRHMHHAARYTAAGNDLSCGDRYESRIRPAAKSHLLADVHVNLHGYPAHEWTRPLSGYVPANFAFYTIPKGFFLICRYQPGYHEKAKQLLHAAANAISGYEPQRQQNATMLARYSSIVAKANFALIDEVVPYVIEERDNIDYPIEIITEAPDETVYGETFRLAHETQYRVVLAIYESLQQALGGNTSYG